MDRETRRRLEAVRDRLRQNGHSFMRTAPTAARFMREDADTIDAALAALPAAPPLGGCTKKFVACDADEGGPETWCDNCRTRLAAPPPEVVALVREWQAASRDCLGNTDPARSVDVGERSRVAERALLAYPLAEDTDGGTP